MAAEASPPATAPSNRDYRHPISNCVTAETSSWWRPAPAPYKMDETESSDVTMTTPTPIESFEDILAAMENNPSLQAAMRQHVLDQEFLQLPAIVLRLQQTVEQLAQVLSDFMTTTNERLERLEADVAEVKGDVAELKAGQARLEGDMAEVKGDVAELKGGVAGLKGDVAELKAGQARLDGNMNRLIGSDYERKAARRASRLTQRHLGMTAMTIIYAITKPDDNRLPELMDQAINEAAITAEQADELENADIILEGEGRYAVAEVSVIIDEDDVKRARERADLLSQATGTLVAATVIGTHALDHAMQFAEGNDVVIMTLPA